MARMRVPDRRNPIPKAGRAQPVANARANQATTPRIGLGRLAGDDQEHPDIVRHRPCERMFERRLCAEQRVAVQVDGPLRRDAALTQTSIPSAVQRVGRRPRRRTWCARLICLLGRSAKSGSGTARPSPDRHMCSRHNIPGNSPPLERCHCGCDTRPKREFFSAETWPRWHRVVLPALHAAISRECRAAPGSASARVQTCHRP